MVFLSSAIPLALMASLVAGAPFNATTAKSQNPYITVQNDCSYSLTVGQSKNGDLSGTSVEVSAGASHTFNFEPNWAGRVWGRRSCEGHDCDYSALDNPASLAEVLFKDHAGDDYYDISLVDAYNEPMAMEPIRPDMTSSQDKRRCGVPRCTTAPKCPEELQLKDSTGQVIGCQSACSKFRSPEYCCTGKFDENTCKASEYAKLFKDACPDAYSYAYDDATSTYMCRAEGYKVTFCPK